MAPAPDPIVTRDEPTRLQDAQERAVGISVFVRPDTAGFTCTVKQRYTDFLVNEILPSGEVLHLVGSSGPPEKKRKRDNTEQEARKKIKAEGQGQPAAHSNEQNGVDKGDGSAAADANKASVEAVKAAAIASIPDEDTATLKGVFGDDVTHAILQLYASVVAYPSRKARDFTSIQSDPISEKAKRTEAHMCIRHIFSSKLETITVQDQDHQSGPGTIISIKAAPPKAIATPNSDNSNGDGQRGKQAWSELGGEYLHFSLYKENKDTMEVLHFLASQLKMHIKHFSFAGTKDRRAVTVQRVAIHRIKRERIEHLNRLSRGWRLGGPWEYKPEGLELGMLGGNEFLLTLRDARYEGEEDTWSMERRLDHARCVTEAAALSFSKSGFLNYYGLQRFGSYANGTHVIGMKILKLDLKGATDAILSYDSVLLEENQSGANGDSKVPQDDVARANGLQAFFTSGSSNEALDQIPRRFTAERSLVTHLGKRDRKTGQRPNENDFQGALMSIQRNLRLMYVHAYQSFVWNTVAGKRWEMFGESVVEGDLVVVGEKERSEGGTNSHAAVSQEVDEDGEPIIHPSASVVSSADEGQSSLSANPGGIAEDPYVRARPLSKADVESGRYNIFDIVLPLPGYDVSYPANALGKFYEEFMASDSGGGLDPHSMRRAWKDISLSGGYRKMMARPLGDGVVVDVKAYGSPEEQMVQTDVERLEAEAAAAVEAAGNSGAVENKDKIAVVLKLQLGSSQYATMALREIAKGGAVGYRPEFSAANR